MFPLVYRANELTADKKEDLLQKASLFDWVKPTWSLTTEQIEEAAGLDNAMMIQFTDMVIRILGILVIPQLLILSPMNGCIGGNYSGMDRLSKLGMANVPPDHWLHWIHACDVLFVAVLVEWQVFKFQRKYLDRRFAWMRKRPMPAATSVIVQDIPFDLQSDAQLKRYFTAMFSEEAIVAAHVVKKAPHLVHLKRTIREAEKALKRAKFQWKKDGRTEATRPMIRDDRFTLVPEIDYREEKLTSLRQQLNEGQSEFKEKCKSPNAEIYACNGFVTFATLRDFTIARSLKYKHDLDQLVVSAAPNPGDVLYRSLEMDPGVNRVLTVTGYVLLTGLFFGFMPLVSLVIVMGDLENLETIGLPSKWISDYPITSAAIESFISSGILTVFMSFLPTVMTAITQNFFAFHSLREGQQKLQVWYFWFLVVFVVLITALGSSFWDFINVLVKEPTQVVVLLANSLPQVTHFYLGWVALQWVSHSTVLLRFAPLFKFLGFRVLYEQEDAKQMAEPEDQGYYGIGARSARLTCEFVVCLVFCTLSPLVCILGLCSFTIVKTSFTYLTVYSETKKPDLGGVFWVTQLHHVHYGLWIYLLLMLGVMAGKAPTCGPAIIVAFALLYCMIAYYRFDRALNWETMSFEETVLHVDSMVKSQDTGETYVQPEMRMLMEARSFNLEDEEASEASTTAHSTRRPSAADNDAPAVLAGQ